MHMSISAGLKTGGRRVILESRNMPAGIKAGGSFMLEELGKDVTVHDVVNETVFVRLGSEDYEAVKAAVHRKAAA